jgi:hypothetical protein
LLISLSALLKRFARACQSLPKSNEITGQVKDTFVVAKNHFLSSCASALSINGNGTQYFAKPRLVSFLFFCQPQNKTDTVYDR